tara:strand:+ start:324116 stop:326437 length:2322 start_codon:yes stop_codon:yes gene_type:complete
MQQIRSRIARLRKTAIATAVGVASVPALSQSLVLEEVIVTAQKRVESVQDIAATVNVVTAESLEKFETFGFAELEQQTAGLTLSSPNARNSSISMRGVSIDPEAGAASAVDVYWNEAVVRADVAFSQLYDLQRIEILRGPQGTLQGNTSPGGAINLITRRADLEVASGYVQGSLSSNDGVNLQAAYGAPIIPGTFGMRVAGVFDQNNSNDVENITSGLDDPQAEAYSGRLSTVWQVTDTLNAELVYQYLNREIDDPKAMSGTDLLGVRPTLDSTDQTALGKTNDYGELRFDLANLILNWEFAGHDVAGIIGYQDSEKRSRTENDRANYIQSGAPTWQMAETEADSSSYELRISSSDNDFWDYMVGFYYRDQNTQTSFFSNGIRLDVLGLGFATQGTLPVNANDLGIFTFNTFYLSESLQLEFGLRWADYERFRRADINYAGLTYVPPPLAPIAGVIDAGFAENFPIEGVSTANESTAEDAFTGSLKLRWDWSDDISVYASYNRGYRPGGISIVPSPDIQFLPNGENDLLHDSEESDAVELGFKSRLMDGRATLNGAWYYQQFDGYFGFTRGVQVLNDVGAPVDLPGGLIFNGDAIIWGVEMEGEILLTETWNLGGAVSYSKGEWDGASAPCNEREPGEVLGSCDIDGEALGGEPEWSLSLNSEYFIPLDDGTQVYLRGLYKYTDTRINTEASAGIGAVTDEFEAYHNLNLYTGWRSADAMWDLSLWVKNVTDEDEITFQQGPDQFDVGVSGGSYTQTNILQERTFGVTGRYNF